MSTNIERCILYTEFGYQPFQSVPNSWSIIFVPNKLHNTFYKCTQKKKKYGPDRVYIYILLFGKLIVRVFKYSTMVVLFFPGNKNIDTIVFTVYIMVMYFYDTFFYFHYYFRRIINTIIIVKKIR